MGFTFAALFAGNNEAKNESSIEAPLIKKKSENLTSIGNESILYCEGSSG
jgi:hypothetical protein